MKCQTPGAELQRQSWKGVVEQCFSLVSIFSQLSLENEAQMIRLCQLPPCRDAELGLLQMSWMQRVVASAPVGCVPRARDL